MSLGVSDNVLPEAHNNGGQNSEAHNDGGQNSQHPKQMARKMLLGNRFYGIKNTLIKMFPFTPSIITFLLSIAY